MSIFQDVLRRYIFLPVLNSNRVYHRNPNISARVSNNIINYFNTLLNYVDISAAVYIVTGSHRNRLDHVRLLVVKFVMNIMRASDTTQHLFFCWHLVYFLRILITVTISFLVSLRSRLPRSCVITIFSISSTAYIYPFLSRPLSRGFIANTDLICLFFFFYTAHYYMTTPFLYSLTTYKTVELRHCSASSFSC